jgi:hypothetical protein
LALRLRLRAGLRPSLRAEAGPSLRAGAEVEGRGWGEAAEGLRPRSEFEDEAFLRCDDLAGEDPLSLGNRESAI